MRQTGLRVSVYALTELHFGQLHSSVYSWKKETDNFVTWLQEPQSDFLKKNKINKKNGTKAGRSNSQCFYCC